MCESCQAIFRNNILYREIARSRKGTSYVHALCECQSAVRVRSFCFHQHGYKNYISLVWTHGEFDINIHKAGMLCFAIIDTLVMSSSSQPEVIREKGTLLIRRINKVHFRCLITI